MYIRNSRREKTINEVPDGYSGTAFFEDKKQNHEDECHDEKPEAVPQKSDDIHKEPSCARTNLLPTMKFDLNTIMNTDFLYSGFFYVPFHLVLNCFGYNREKSGVIFNAINCVCIFMDFLC